MTSDEDNNDSFINKFDGRAKFYSKHRPRYPTEVIHALEKEIGFNRGMVVADIGSGTGILSELFLKNGNKVYCIEPNKGMRAVAERQLKRFAPNFISVDGTAEMTTLDDKSIDLITVGQALHWFNVEKSRKEFSRILKSGGSVVVVYNVRREQSDVEKAYAKITNNFANRRADTPHVDDAYIARFFNSVEFKRLVISNPQTYDIEGMLGRLASISYMPNKGSQEWKKVEKEAQAIFKKYSNNSLVALQHDTVMHVGKINQAEQL